MQTILKCVGLMPVDRRYVHTAKALSVHTVVALFYVACLTIDTRTSVARDKGSNTCSLEAGPSATIANVLDSQTLRLADGRSVRLLGLVGPRPPLTVDDASTWQPEQAAREALITLTEGRTITLAFDHRQRDRYGRLLAHVFVWYNGRRFWVQGELLSHGHARAAILPGTTACTKELLTHENIARDAGLGLWQQRYYRVLKPNPARWLLARRRHRFEIVEGTVKDVAIVKSRVYLNFGDNWRTDFTAALPKKALRGTTMSPDTLRALKGQRVRVRGWIERNNGPYMKLAHPDIIERLEPDTFQRPNTQSPNSQSVEPKVAGGHPAPHSDQKKYLKMPRILPRAPRKKKKRPATSPSPSAQDL